MAVVAQALAAEVVAHVEAHLAVLTALPALVGGHVALTLDQAAGRLRALATAGIARFTSLAHPRVTFSGVSTHPKGEGRGGFVHARTDLPAAGRLPIGGLRPRKAIFAEPRPPTTVKRSPFCETSQRQIRYEV